MTDPIQPRQAVELYLDSRRDELAESTLTAHQRRLKHFIRWCEAVEDVEGMGEIDGRILHDYRLWRRDDGDLNSVSLKTQLTTLRVFLRFCESIEAVPEGVHEKIILPNLARGENTRDAKIEPDEAMDVLDYLRKYEYATSKHVAFEILWHAGCRIGELRAIDLDDYNPSEGYLSIVHRPQKGTPLKNQQEGERLVGLSGEYLGLLDDYIGDVRPDVTDENGREPLLATTYGRPAYSTIRKWIYKVSRPCVYLDNCPSGRSPQDCDAAGHDRVYECPHNINPHGIRRGAITYHLLRDWPEADVADRMNVSPKVLKKHYDRRTKKERLEQRRRNLTKL